MLITSHAIDKWYSATARRTPECEISPNGQETVPREDGWMLFQDQERAERENFRRNLLGVIDVRLAEKIWAAHRRRVRAEQEFSRPSAQAERLYKIRLLYKERSERRGCSISRREENLKERRAPHHSSRSFSDISPSLFSSAQIHAEV